jgi:peptidoglycan-associated lipoprotein
MYQVSADTNNVEVVNVPLSEEFQIRKDAMPVLDANASWFRANGSMTVLIEGHCDERGTVAYNLVLGEKRARAAKKYLQDLGVQASQLQTTSYGETRPFCKQQNEDCYQQNRRAHFVTQ